MEATVSDLSEHLRLNDRFAYALISVTRHGQGGRELASAQIGDDSSAALGQAAWQGNYAG